MLTHWQMMNKSSDENLTKMTRWSLLSGLLTKPDTTLYILWPWFTRIRLQHTRPHMGKRNAARWKSIAHCIQLAGVPVSNVFLRKPTLLWNQLTFFHMVIYFWLKYERGWFKSSSLYCKVIQVRCFSWCTTAADRTAIFYSTVIRV